MTEKIDASRQLVLNRSLADALRCARRLDRYSEAYKAALTFARRLRELGAKDEKEDIHARRS